MLFKFNDKVLFRQYEKYGYLTDNSMFGYRFLNDERPAMKEKLISQSGSVMLGLLSRTYQDLDAIVRKLYDVFIDVDYDTLRQDTLDFFAQLVSEGYLDCSEQLEVSAILPQESIAPEFDTEQECILKSIHIEIANICNERCVHCFIPEKNKTHLMTPELFSKILDEGRAMNIIHVTITGGEPMMHPEFIRFLKKCRELDLSVNVLSNLTLLTDDIISEMQKNVLLSVQASLYSMRHSVHDSITRLPGSCEKTKSGILRLIQANIPVQVSCQVMKQNKDSFGEVIQWGNANNIPVAFNCMIFGSYDHSNVNIRNRLSVNDVEEV